MTTTRARPLAASMALVAMVALAGLAGCKLDTLIFSPNTVAEYQFPSTVIADSLRSVVSFRSGGETLYAVRVRRPGSAARLTVLVSHGKGGDISRDSEWKRVEALWQAGFDVVAYDYRGYGKSTGESDGEASLFTDARAALTYVLTLPGVTTQTLVLYGHSLGGVPTTELAATLGRSSATLRAVVLESSFASGEAMAQSATILDIPGQWLLDGKFDNVGKLPDVHAPILILAGSEDVQIPRAQTDALYARANDPKQLRIVAGAVHDDCPATLGTAAYTALLQALTAPRP